MARIPASVTESVERFLAAVRRNWRVDAAYVFGSHALGRAHEWSDIDLAIISPDFAHDRLSKRVELLQLAAELDDRIEACPFSPSDFVPADPLADQIRRTGVRIA